MCLERTLLRFMAEGFRVEGLGLRLQGFLEKIFSISHAMVLVQNPRAST